MSDDIHAEDAHAKQVHERFARTAERVAERERERRAELREKVREFVPLTGVASANMSFAGATENPKSNSKLPSSPAR